MGFRCVVVDDERPARDKLKRLLAAHGDFAVVGEAADADAAVRLLDELRPDLCFLDVQMPEGDGFDVLERVRSIPSVIFTTAYDQYAVKAFEVNSLDYLLKPFGKRRLAEALDRARQALGKNEDLSDAVRRLAEQMRTASRAGADAPRRISARRGPKIVVLDLGDVLWFEAEETLVFARTDGGRYLVERTLAELEQQCAPDFFRSHRGYLINLGRIAEIAPGEAGTYRIVMRDEKASRVPLSRRQARKLKELIPW